jgi:hypothetical protein
LGSAAQIGNTAHQGDHVRFKTGLQLYAARSVLDKLRGNSSRTGRKENYKG